MPRTENDATPPRSLSTDPADDAAWTRGRGWAQWKASITLAQQADTNPAAAQAAERVIEDILSDYEQ